MLKYDQLKANIAKHKYWHKYYKLEQTAHDCITFGYTGSHNMSVFDNDDFEIHSIYSLYNNDGAKVAMICAMPFPILLEKRRSGMYLNGTRWYDKPLRFNAIGDCLNAPTQVVEDTDEKRKLFNKYMLNWQKQLSVLVKMDPSRVGIKREYDYTVYHRVFKEIPVIDHYDIYIQGYTSAYFGTGQTNSSEDKIKAIKNFRKRQQDTLYAEWLEGTVPEIDTWLTEKGLVICEESSP